MAPPSPSKASAPIPASPRARWRHAIKIAAAIVERLPKDTCSPETTEGKEGFLHPTGITGTLEKSHARLHRPRFYRGRAEAEGKRCWRTSSRT